MARLHRHGTAPSGKMTKAEKKRAKKQRVKGRLAIQAATRRIERYFATGMDFSRVSLGKSGMPEFESLKPEDVMRGRLALMHSCGKPAFYLIRRPRDLELIRSADAVLLDGSRPEPLQRILCGSCGEQLQQPDLNPDKVVEL